MNEVLYIKPTEIAVKEHLSKYAKLNTQLAKVVAALIELGSFEHEILYSTKVDLIKIQNLYGISPYHHIMVYDDGYLGYFDVLGNIQFEGTTKRKSILKLDIQKK